MISPAAHTYGDEMFLRENRESRSVSFSRTAVIC